MKKLYLPELRDHKEYIFIEDVDDQVRVSPVTLSPMHKKQVFQELELSDCIVGCTSSLLTLKTTYTHTYVGRSYHVYVISSISNSQSSSFWVLLPNKHDDFCFLFG